MKNLNIKATKGLKAAFYTDMHGIYVSEPAVDAAVSAMKAFGPDMVIDGGDAIDSAALGKFSKTLAQLQSLQADIKKSIEMHELVIAAMPDARHIALRGNHCLRVESSLQAVPGLQTLDDLKLEALLGYDDMGMDYVEHSVFIGKGQQQGVEFTHGIYALQNPGASVYKLALTRGFASHLCQGHSHKVSMQIQNTASGPVTLIEAGWLGDIDKIQYAEGKTMNWAAAVVLVEWLGSPLRPRFEVVPITISGKKASAFWRGKEYRT